MTDTVDLNKSLVTLDSILDIVYLPRMREIAGNKTLRWIRRDGNILCYEKSQEYGDTYEALLTATKPDGTYLRGRLLLIEEKLRGLTPEQFTRFVWLELEALAKEFKDELRPK